MKMCTGERYQGEHQMLASINGWHGKFGHLNVLTLDHEDICTHHGKHDRVTTSLPQYDEEVDAIAIYVRVDHVWDLGMPTEAQILDVIRKHDGTKGHWKIAKQATYVGDLGEATDIYLVRA
jgi:hypothetical protein